MAIIAISGCIADAPHAYSLVVETEQHLHKFACVQDVDVVAEYGVTERAVTYFGSGRHAIVHGALDNRMEREPLCIGIRFGDGSYRQLSGVQSYDAGIGTATILLTHENGTNLEIVGVKSYTLV